VDGGKKEPGFMNLKEIRRLVIIALFSDDELMEKLVLKGGNALDIVHNIGTRTSVDIDLSIPDDFSDIEEIVPEEVLTRNKLIPRSAALRQDISRRRVRLRRQTFNFPKAPPSRLRRAGLSVHSHA